MFKHRPLSVVLIALGILFGVGPLGSAQQAEKPLESPVSKELLNRLPINWRQTAARYLTMRRGEEAALLKLSDSEIVGLVMDRLAGKAGAEAFVITHLSDPLIGKIRRRLILLDISHMYRDIWLSQPQVDPVLEQIAQTDPDYEIATTALESARILKMYRLRAILEGRLEQECGDKNLKWTAEVCAGLERQADEQWVSIARGTMLPGFLRETPPVFTINVPSKSIRAVAIGDFGVGETELKGDEQKQVADAMQQYHRQHPFDFGITLGDNFHGEGTPSPEDPRWKTAWEDMYGPMKIQFYPVMGNHDWYGSDSPAAELLYHSPSSTWYMPAPYYTYMAGPVQFFAIDTYNISPIQLDWLKRELDRSPARWKVVYGHYPPYIAGLNGTISYPDLPEMTKDVMPILAGRADVYIAGHHHSLQHLKPVSGVNLFISGGGGRMVYPVDPTSPVALFASSVHGFSVIEADEHSFTFRFVDKEGRQLYETRLRK